MADSEARRGLHGGSDFQDPVLFPPDKYLLETHPGCDERKHDMGRPNRIVMECLHQAMSSGWFSGERFADICSGPSIHGAMSASKIFPKVYLTEYAPHCLHYLQSWLDDQSHSHDWASFLHCVAELEGQGTTPQGIEERVRKSIHGLVPCDLSKDKPLNDHWTKEMIPLDCILSSLTLENVAYSRESYGKALKALSNCLREGGGLILVGVLNESSYTINGRKFFCININKDVVRNEVEEAGFNILQLKCFNLDYSSSDNQDDDLHQLYVLCAIKNMQANRVLRTVNH